MAAFREIELLVVIMLSAVIGCSGDPGRDGADNRQTASRFGHHEPSPRFRCQGNEPFWNLEILGAEGRYTALNDDRRERALTARWHWNAATSPPTLEWRASQHDSPDVFALALIVEEECLDTMSDETPPFSHRVAVDLSPGGRVEGCCRRLP